MMRGAAVPAGSHMLVYRYSPASFRIGLALSAAGFAALLISLLRYRASDRTGRGTTSPPASPAGSMRAAHCLS